MTTIKLKYLLSEQPSDYVMDRRANALMHATGIRSDADYKKADSFITSAQQHNKDLFPTSFDDIVDIVSAILDATGIGIPVSIVVDVAHAISYFIRFKWFSSTDLEYFENLFNGIATAILAYIPAVGNAALIIGRKGISHMVKGIELAKGVVSWKLLIPYWLIKYLGGEQLEEYITIVSAKLSAIKQAYVKKYGNGGLESIFNRIIKFLSWMIDTGIKQAKKLFDTESSDIAENMRRFGTKNLTESVIKYKKPNPVTFEKDTTLKDPESGNPRQNVIKITNNISGDRVWYKLIGTSPFGTWDLNFKSIGQDSNYNLIFNRYIDGGISVEEISLEDVHSIIPDLAKGKSVIKISKSIGSIKFYKVK